MKAIFFALAASSVALATQPAEAQYRDYGSPYNNLNPPARTTYQRGYRIDTYNTPSPNLIPSQRTTIRRSNPNSTMCSWGMC